MDSPVSGEAQAESIGEKLAEQLRALRSRRRWTLEQLAATSGVSRSMLSQIERRQASPTLVVAMRIAAAFGMSLDELVGVSTARSSIDVIRADDGSSQFRLEPGLRMRTLSPLHLEKEVELYEVQLGPGRALTSAAHYAGTRELVTVVRGRVRITAGPEHQDLRTGDSAHYAADVPHAIENIGAREALVLLVDHYPRA